MSARSVSLLVLAAFAGAAFLWYLWPTHGVSVKGIEAQVGLRAPVGAPLEQLLAVLDSMKAEHSDGANRLVTANFGQSTAQGLVTGEVFGTFHIDGRGRIASYEIKEFFTGP